MSPAASEHLPADDLVTALSLSGWRKHRDLRCAGPAAVDRQVCGVLTAEIRGWIVCFLNRISLDFGRPGALRFYPAGLIDFPRETPGETTRESTTMPTMLTDLVQQLQDIHTHHLNGDGRVIVAVPITPHTLEQFEVGKVHPDGPSVVLHCQPLREERAWHQAEQARTQDEQARAQDEQAKPPAKKTWACLHNDYKDLL